jgi:hypothetical protein
MAVADAQLLYQKAIGKNIELTFSFDKEHPVQNVGTLAKNIMGLAQHIDDRDNGKIPKAVFQNIPELGFVRLYRPGDAARWRVEQGHRFGFTSPERLMDIIKEKEIKAGRYAACDAYWLLVVVEFLNAAQQQEIRIDGFDKLHSAVFENIIVYKPFFEHIRETNGRQPASAM